MKKKITFITTVSHNVGDDFVREGLKFLLKKHFSNDQIQFTSIHKHSPITSSYGFEWLRSHRYGRRIDPFLPKSLVPDRITEADLVIQSGAPVYWCHPTDNSYCSNNEWYTPLIRERLKKFGKAKLLNIAAGTCQPYFSDGSEFLSNPDVVAYIKEFYQDSVLSTVRDRLALNLVQNLGLYDVPLLPCTSIFAAEEHGVLPGPDEYVLLNYMKGGAHYTLGQDIHVEEWEKTFGKFYSFLKEREKVALVCHNEAELEAAKKFDPAGTFFYSASYVDYMKFYSRAKFSFLNRVHGGFMQGSLGKPSLIIGNDTRAKMSAEVGLESVFVNDASFDFLVSKYEELSSHHTEYRSVIKDIREKAMNAYLNLFQDRIPSL
ncbi:MAG: polysaccharide pyruvyl transferase family protein [Bacteroidetes bacterium]|nr:polysaccharide pyruvyl transferase family protein [Bacteroidota bacterium]